MNPRTTNRTRRPGALPPIVRARWGERDIATRVIIEAFQHDPLAAWLVPDQRERRAVLTGALRIMVEYALLRGEVHLLDDQSAVAVWLNRYRPLPPPHGFGRDLAEICGGNTDRFTVLARLLDAQRPTESHYHLAALAVTPKWQRTGRGAALLREHHTHLDRNGLPAYTEVTNATNHDVYTRHGYLPHPPINLPNGGTIHPMWRPPTQTLCEETTTRTGPRRPLPGSPANCNGTHPQLTNERFDSSLSL